MSLKTIARVAAKEEELSHKRERSTGRYLHRKMTRLCKCGHPVGVHSAEKGKNPETGAKEQPCYAGDHGFDCDCELFTPTSKYLTDEEYEAKYGKL
jgi:hypothetical protein